MLDPGQAKLATGGLGQGEGGRDTGGLEQPQVQGYPGVKPTGLQRGVSLEEDAVRGPNVLTLWRPPRLQPRLSSNRRISKRHLC